MSNNTTIPTAPSPAIDVNHISEALARAVLAQLEPLLTGRRLMTRSELADYLRVQPAQVGRLEAKGLPVVHVGEASPRYDLGEVRRWLAERGADGARTPAAARREAGLPAGVSRISGRGSAGSPLPEGVKPIQRRGGR